MHSEEEIVTNSLSVEQLQESIPDITRFLTSIDRMRISVEFGWGCNLSTQQLWNSTHMDLPQLQEFVENSQRNGTLKLGSGDLIIRDAEESMSFTVCHESDLHFVASDKRLLEQVTAMWSGKGFTLNIGTHTIGSRREWRRVDAPD